MILNLICALAIFLLSSQLGYCAEDTKTAEQIQFEKRISRLERKLNEVQAERVQSANRVDSFLPTNIIIGGFFESGLTGVHQANKSTQLASNENILGLNVGAEFSPKIRFVSQLLASLSLPLLNQHNDPRATSLGLPAVREFRDYSVVAQISQGYLQYSVSDSFNVLGGMGYAPFGIAFQEYELVLLARRGGPQMLRTSTLLSPLWQGLNITGRIPVASTSLHFNVYTFSPPLNPKMLGAGGRLYWKSSRDKIKVGFSTQTGRRGGDSFYTVGPDFRIKIDSILITSELAKGYGPGGQPWSAYLEPAIETFNQSILFFVFGDYAENPLNRTGSATTGDLDPIMKWEYGGGINWLPSSYTRLRLGLSYNDYVGITQNTGGTSRD